jgi:uncharacterized membrane protein YhaH (DUF805 family)
LIWSYLVQWEASGGGAFERGKVSGHRGPSPHSFGGRAGRKEWWRATIGYGIVGAIVAAVPGIGALLSLPWAFATLAVNARRLHDLAASAWLQLIPLAAGIGLAALIFSLGGPDIAFEPSWTLATLEGVLTICGAATALVYLGFYAWIGFAPGRSGPNCYGEADAG